MSFIIKNKELYRESCKDYIIKNDILYLKCKDWINIDGKSIRSATLIKYLIKNQS
jgi:hypothetical protein